MKAVSHGPVDSMFANGAWEEMRKAYGLPDYKRKVQLHQQLLILKPYAVFTMPLLL